MMKQSLMDFALSKIAKLFWDPEAEKCEGLNSATLPKITQKSGKRTSELTTPPNRRALYNSISASQQLSALPEKANPDRFIVKRVNRESNKR